MRGRGRLGTEDPPAVSARRASPQSVAILCHDSLVLAELPELQLHPWASDTSRPMRRTACLQGFPGTLIGSCRGVPIDPCGMDAGRMGGSKTGRYGLDIVVWSAVAVTEWGRHGVQTW